MPVDFLRDIRPILADRCFACHGPDASNREADLRLDLEIEAKQQGDQGAAVVPHQVDASLLMQRITSSDVDRRMPPASSGKSLSDVEIATLRRWIESGASWSRPWALVAPQRATTPLVVQRDWPRHWIDHFLLARMEANGIKPSPDADRITLARRASLDLTGLPPSIADIDAFVQDRSPQAYARWIDRLLASPHFGERLAMLWLDLVRYADTVGYHGDQDHSISPYRDYVINAFNDDLAFDQMTIEQLAGDLLPQPTVDQRIATGYNRLLQTSHEGGVQPKEYLAIYAADRVRNISAVWLGATLGCCQCHDHKFDPLSSRDFYAMAAFFADVDEAQHFKIGTNELPTKRPPEEFVLSRIDRDRLVAIDRTLTNLRTALHNATGDASETLQQQILQLEARQRIVQQNARPTMITVSLAEPREVHLLPRGNWLDESGPLIAPSVPSILAEGTWDHPASQRATRLDLARWLTQGERGVGLFTARVMVNRLWHVCFGAPLVRSPEDFGAQGEMPTHPELLDRLAHAFVDSGWDMKAMLRQMVMSRAYQQSSLVDHETMVRDPNNMWFARQGRYRLPAELIRDMALATSQLLVREIGGASVRPYQPAGYYRHLNFPEREYVADTDRQQWRRGVYVHWQRQYLHPTFRSLDAPTREECTAQRAVSNTPLAALALLNDPTFVEAARELAKHVLLSSATSPIGTRDDARVARHLFRTVISRGPSDDEIAALVDLVKAERAAIERRAAEAAQILTVGQAPADTEIPPAELVAWTAAARVVLNLHEAITRN